jgi:hypothetical protein
MSELREAMVDKMLLKGFSLRTQKSYLDAVSLLARHYHASPDTLDPTAIQNWFLYLVKERRLSQPINIDTHRLKKKINKHRHP